MLLTYVIANKGHIVINKIIKVKLLPRVSAQYPNLSRRFPALPELELNMKRRCRMFNYLVEAFFVASISLSFVILIKKSLTFIHRYKGWLTHEAVCVFVCVCVMCRLWNLMYM